MQTGNHQEYHPQKAVHPAVEGGLFFFREKEMHGHVGLPVSGSIKNSEISGCDKKKEVARFGQPLSAIEL